MLPILWSTLIRSSCIAIVLATSMYAMACRADTESWYPTRQQEGAGTQVARSRGKDGLERGKLYVPSVICLGRGACA
jgi:hypothetical protein